MPPRLLPTETGRWVLAPAEADAARADLLRRIREGGRDRPTDLRGVRLMEVDLKGVDLSGCDLVGAELSGSDLTGARLGKADLGSANLDGAILDRAELAGASLLGASFEEASLVRTGFGRVDARKASFFGANLEGASFVGAKLAKADMRSAMCSGARFQAAELTGADFGKADLSHADLSSANVHKASFVEADLRRARLRSLRGFESAAFLRADVRDVDFSGAYLLRRHIVDENYLDEFKNRSRLNRVVHFVWWITSDCGRSLFRWSLWTLAIALAFGFAYMAASVDYGDHETWLSPFYFSLVTLTTLGYGDVLPASDVAQAMAMAEVSLGYMMLGGLISIFSNKLARRGE